MARKRLSFSFLFVYFASTAKVLYAPLVPEVIFLTLLHDTFQPVHEMEERLKTKVKERNQIISDENQKLSALKSEIECKLQCLEPREKKVEAMIAKVICLF
jgi:hypothetical protein